MALNLNKGKHTWNLNHHIIHNLDIILNEMWKEREKFGNRFKNYILKIWFYFFHSTFHINDDYQFTCSSLS